MLAAECGDFAGLLELYLPQCCREARTDEVDQVSSWHILARAIEVQYDLAEELFVHGVSVSVIRAGLLDRMVHSGRQIPGIEASAVLDIVLGGELHLEDARQPLKRAFEWVACQIDDGEVVLRATGAVLRDYGDVELADATFQLYIARGALARTWSQELFL